MDHKAKTKTEAIMDNIKVAFGGAATALATKDAAENNAKISLERVNEWTKVLNEIAGYLIFAYILTMVGLGMGVHYAEGEAFKMVYARMTSAEVTDYKGRLETGRIGPIPVTGGRPKCAELNPEKAK